MIYEVVPVDLGPSISQSPKHCGGPLNHQAALPLRQQHIQSQCLPIRTMRRPDEVHQENKGSHYTGALCIRNGSAKFQELAARAAGSIMMGEPPVHCRGCDWERAALNMSDYTTAAVIDTLAEMS